MGHFITDEQLKAGGRYCYVRDPQGSSARLIEPPIWLGPIDEAMLISESGMEEGWYRRFGIGTPSLPIRHFDGSMMHPDTYQRLRRDKGLAPMPGKEIRFQLRSLHTSYVTWGHGISNSDDGMTLQNRNGQLRYISRR